ncbi:iron chelate uptake ABC transporter family permease subunit [Pseudooceanicola sp. CBS1P-1]|uniref:Iron chelate uptake ABC transporter family permease subunit n=1 Tax=Pseudooceanicola albus TaxID=2692189 RepID=A0A6L7G3W7_9RHOB|nr:MULTISPECIES: iron chelate uptake ABC transporter family permease subunit [Pseudooceanicola]MBT9384945.1 iron chelate uptake ABC transporter family permease subunit [Pseudooceanicola endophyticus]MXN18060.1 iron chelate uptake ABC transporter family permease subunit [Pseudooceanicola albus]
MLAALALVSLMTGAVPVTLRDLLTDPEGQKLLVVSRIPRTLAALLAGGALAVCGQIMQILARNRFVEPMTAGAGQSAALGILIAALLFPATAIWAKMGIAALTTLIGTAGLMLLIRPLPPTQPLLVPLVALVYGGVIGAFVTYFAYQGDMMQFIGTWLTGELSGVLQGRYELLWVAAISAGVTWFIADRITVLSLGEDAARGLGLNVGLVSAAGLGAISITTAMVVVTLGAIPFVGLVIPNIVARRMGDNLRRALPVAAFSGAALVLAGDILGRILRAPFEIPVATVVGLAGALVFLILLYSEPRHG